LTLLLYVCVVHTHEPNPRTVDLAFGQVDL